MGYLVYVFTIVLILVLVALTVYLKFLLEWAPYFTGLLLAYLLYEIVPHAKNLISGHAVYSFFAVLGIVEVLILIVMLIPSLKDAGCFATSLIGDSMLICLPAAIIFKKQMNEFSVCLFLTIIAVIGTVLTAVINHEMRKTDQSVSIRKKGLSHLVCAILYLIGFSVTAVIIYAGIWTSYLNTTGGSNLSNVILIAAAVFGLLFYIVQNMIVSSFHK